MKILDEIEIGSIIREQGYLLDHLQLTDPRLIPFKKS